MNFDSKGHVAVKVMVKKETLIPKVFEPITSGLDRLTLSCELQGQTRAGLGFEVNYDLHT